MKYIVIVKIINDYYLTKVEASSQCKAEHMILDMGICGLHEYGVNEATAYNEKEMNNDTFTSMAMIANPVSLEELAKIIDANNTRIAKDEAEKRIRVIEKQMKKLAEELKAAKRILDA